MAERSVPVSGPCFDGALEPPIAARSIGKGRPPKLGRRQVFRAMLDVRRTGLPWRDPRSGRGQVRRRATVLGTMAPGAPSAAWAAARGGASG